MCTYRYRPSMSFEVSAEAYNAYMGRYSRPLARELATLVGVAAGQRALDVGSGSGVLTEVLVELLGAGAVSAVDPSQPLVSWARERWPDVDIRVGKAEALPHPDSSFDRTLAQLVVQFMDDAEQGLREMARVTAPGGVVAASVWDHGRGGRGPLTVFWQAARAQDPAVDDEADKIGVDEGDLAARFAAAGMAGAISTSLQVAVRHETFDDWWDPFTLGVGPAGAYVASLSDVARDDLRERCRALQPDPPFTVTPVAWTVMWTKPV
jgi:SAM-dependent methyltransferase